MYEMLIIAKSQGILLPKLISSKCINSIYKHQYIGSEKKLIIHD